MRREKGRPPILSIAEVTTAANGNPLTFLRAFHTMALDRNRAKIAFDHEALSWMVRMWDHAAIASAGSPSLRAACIHERDRCKHLYAMLKDAEGETTQFGMVYLDKPSDWPHPEIIKQAVEAMRFAEIRTVH